MYSKWAFGSSAGPLTPCETKQRFFYNISIPWCAVIFLSVGPRWQVSNSAHTKLSLMPKSESPAVTQCLALEDLGRWIEADPLGRTRPVVLEVLLVGTRPRFHRSVVSLFKLHPGLILMSFWLGNISHSHFLSLLSTSIFFPILQLRLSEFCLHCNYQVYDLFKYAELWYRILNASLLEAFGVTVKSLEQSCFQILRQDQVLLRRVLSPGMSLDKQITRWNANLPGGWMLRIKMTRAFSEVCFQPCSAVSACGPTEGSMSVGFYVKPPNQWMNVLYVLFMRNWASPLTINVLNKQPANINWLIQHALKNQTKMFLKIKCIHFKWSKPCTNKSMYYKCCILVIKRNNRMLWYTRSDLLWEGFHLIVKQYNTW